MGAAGIFVMCLLRQLACLCVGKCNPFDTPPFLLDMAPTQKLWDWAGLWDCIPGRAEGLGLHPWAGLETVRDWGLSAWEG